MHCRKLSQPPFFQPFLQSFFQCRVSARLFPTSLIFAALSFSTLPGSIPAYADGPGDNDAASVRRIPPPGVEVPAADRAELEKGIAQLGTEIDGLRKSLSPALRDLLPDVQIYHNAVRYALTYNEFFNVREIATAKTLLQQGMERAAQLRAGKPAWTSATGLVVRGYVSKIDGSVQPYGLVVPDDYNASPSASPAISAISISSNSSTFNSSLGTDARRLDIWYHGRGENLSELNFINDRQRNKGDFTPPGAFVLHPYGRYCNANRFAGETDTWEALDAVRKHYHINPDAIVTRGFSMGGAACWQFATHFAGEWAAASPGAGFSETAEFLHITQNDPIPIPWYQQRLWHWYDSVDYAENLFNCPTVAYSGEIDGQRQAAERMSGAMQAEGLTLTHIIGPKAGHFYEANAKKEVAHLVDQQAAKQGGGYLPDADLPTALRAASHSMQIPQRVRFSTWTLRYNKMKWVQIDGLEKHWERGRVEADITDPHTIAVKTQNVTAFTLAMPMRESPLKFDASIQLVVNGQAITAPAVENAGIWTVRLHHDGLPNTWKLGETKSKGLRKLHDLQGPIDDAFMDSFVMVTPTGTARSAKIGTWTQTEQTHAIEHWRRQYRGEARVKPDTAITSQDIANSNLILWGDPASNKILARIASRLPIGWDAQAVRVGSQSFAGDHHVPVLIYPNPLNPKKYVVLNSGFTFREYDYLNNARQTSKLPDYAVIDVDVPVSSRTPGGVVKAGFFDERWQLQNNDGQ